LRESDRSRTALHLVAHCARNSILAEGRFSEAEQTLLNAKKYGNFATLEYEIAAVRFASGFYREAADELRKSFVAKDGVVSTKLGRRIERSEKSFPELLAYERRASILSPKSPDNVDDAERMKTLLEFSSLLASSSPDPARAAELADAFSKGTDRMRFHRKTYAANALLEKRVAPAKALELSRSAVSAVDDGLSIPAPAAPIMANELYDRRAAAMAMDRYVVVPDLPKQALSAIARGRIEEIAGWSLMEQGNHAEAVTRLRRAVSILPERSVWWRSSMWRLGTALEAEGKDKDALDTYVKLYTSSDPDAAKYSSIEAVFKRVNGGTDGLEALIGAKPGKPVQKVAEAPPTVPVETKKETTETTAAPIEEKPASANVSNTENKVPDTKKQPEQVTVIPASVPIDTNKKTDAAPVEEKPVEKPEAPPPVSKIEEKQTEQKQPEKIEEKPVEKAELPPAVSKVEEKQAEQKQPEKVAEIPSPTPVETPKKVDRPPSKRSLLHEMMFRK
jgi:tetratricopeptide (TPR) repeat protein